MRKTLAFMLMVICISGLIGCGSVTTKKQNAMEVNDQGNVTASTYGTFDKDYYDPAELKRQVEDAINEYNTTNGSNYIQLKKCSKDKENVHIVISYASGKDYTAFNGVTCYIGKLSGAVFDGAAEDSVRITSSDGTLKTTIGELNTKSGAEINILVIEEPLVVKVPNDVLYIGGDVEIQKDGTCITGVKSKDETVLDEPCYILYGKK